MENWSREKKKVFTHPLLRNSRKNLDSKSYYYFSKEFTCTRFLNFQEKFTDQIIFTGFQNVDLLFIDCVSIFVKKTSGFVLNIIREMFDYECGLAESGFLKMFTFRAFVIQLLYPWLIGTFLKNNIFTLVFVLIYLT